MCVCVRVCACSAACVGARDGSIYAFVDGVCKAVVANAHAGGVLSVDYFAEGLVSGGEDGKVIVFDKNLKVKQSLQFPGGAVRAVYVSGGNLVVGVSTCEIFHVNNFKEAKIDAATEPVVRVRLCVMLPVLCCVLCVVCCVVL